MSEQQSDLPTAQPVAPLEDRIDRLESEMASLRAASSLPVAEPAPPAIPALPVASNPTTDSPGRAERMLRLGWLLVDMVDEAIAIFRMFVDVRYHVAWSTRVITVVLLVAILTSYWWNPLYSLPLLGQIVGKLVDVALAFIMYKVLSREAARYSESDNRR